MAIDPNSIVDYLRANGEDPSLAARCGLWARFNAREVYTGSAAQNAALLAFLKLAEKTPQVLLEKNLYDSGEDVYATIQSDSTVTIENEFGSQTIQSLPGQRIKLGKLDRVGVFYLQATTALLETAMALIAVPSGSKINVGIWSASYQYSAPPAPVTIPLQPDDDALIDKFFDHLNDQVFLDAANLSIHEYTRADRWLGLGQDVAIGGVVAIISRKQALKFLLQAAIPQLIDFTFIFLRSLVKVMDALSDAEKARMNTILDVLNVAANVAQMGSKVRSLRRAEAFCDEVNALNGIGNLTMKSFTLVPQPASAQDVKIVGSLLRNSVTKSITMVCKVIKASSSS